MRSVTLVHHEQTVRWSCEGKELRVRDRGGCGECVTVYTCALLANSQGTSGNGPAIQNGLAHDQQRAHVGAGHLLHRGVRGRIRVLRRRRSEEQTGALAPSAWSAPT